MWPKFSCMNRDHGYRYYEGVFSQPREIKAGPTRSLLTSPYGSFLHRRIARSLAGCLRGLSAELNYWPGNDRDADADGRNGQ